MKKKFYSRNWKNFRQILDKIKQISVLWEFFKRNQHANKYYTISAFTSPK